MLPDFPSVKRKWSNGFVRLVEEKVPQGTILSLVKKVRHFEGDGLETRSSSGDIDQSKYQEFCQIFEVRNCDVIEKGPNAFLDKLDSVVEGFRKEQIQMMLNQVSESVARTGNSVSAQGKEFSFEHLLAVYEKTDIDFDEEGKPDLPVMLLPESKKDEILEKICKWENDRDCKRRLSELFDRKKKDWLDRESHRKLVD